MSAPYYVASEVLGMDVSLNSTGYVHLEGPDVADYGLLKPTSKALRGWARVDDVLAQFQHLLNCLGPELVVFEDYALGRAQGMVELVEMGTVLRRECGSRGLPIMEVPPSSLKRFATGNGHAKKPAVMAAVRDRWGFQTKSNDIADARVLAEIGRAVTDARAMRSLNPAQLEVVGKLPLPVLCCNQLHRSCPP